MDDVLYELEQAKDDLVWAVTSPQLLTRPNVENHLNDPTLSFDSLAVPGDLKFDAFELAAYLSSRKSHRVGYYFENLISFWLEFIRGVEMVAHGLQIKDGNRTVGELDFVFRDEQQRLSHWETAVKFYLYHPDDPNFESDLIGPNSADNFEKKTKRMFSHQLPLSDEQFPDVVIRRAFVKGIIFYHPQAAKPSELPPSLASDHLRGWWIRESELHLLQKLNQTQKYMLMHKPYWLSASSTKQTSLLDFKQLSGKLKSHFEGRAHPVMLSSCSVDQTQSERFFVVSNSWPAK